MKKILLPLLIALIGGAAWYVFIQVPKQIEQGFQASIPAGYQSSYDQFEVDVLQQTVTISGWKLRNPEMVTEAQFEKVQGTKQGDLLALKARGFQFVDTRNNYQNEVESITVGALNLSTAQSVGQAFQQGEGPGWAALTAATNLMTDVKMGQVKGEHEGRAYEVGDLEVQALDSGTLQGITLRGVRFVDDAHHYSSETAKITAGTLNLQEVHTLEQAFREDPQGIWRALANSSQSLITNFTLEQSKGEGATWTYRLDALGLQSLGSGVAKEFNWRQLVLTINGDTLEIADGNFEEVPFFDPPVDGNTRWLDLFSPGTRLGAIHVQGFRSKAGAKEMQVASVALEPLEAVASTQGKYFKQVQLQVQGFQLSLAELSASLRRNIEPLVKSEVLQLNFGTTLQADHNAGTLSGTVHAGVEALGQLSLTLKVESVPEQLYGHRVWYQGNKTLQKLALGVTLSSLELAYQEQGLVAAFLEQKAQEQGLPVATMVDQLGAMILLQMNNASDQVRAGATQLVEFLKKPQSLKVTSQLQPPLQIGTLVFTATMNQAEVLELLNLKVESNY